MPPTSKKVKRSLYSMKTITDLRHALKEIEKDLLLNSNKILLTKLCDGFIWLTVFLEQKSTGIYTTVISWFELYLNMQNFIHPNDNKLLQLYEKTVPTAISYIIGCLQYKPKNNFTFHFRLFEIIDALLKNIPPNVIKECSTLSNGTIACLWNPITFAADFNTQILGLKIFAQLLKSFDADRVESELKAIKWFNLKLFKDKLIRVIEGSSHLFSYENACRDLLNNFNMGLARKIFIYSLDCESVVMCNEFEFYKPLIINKFWVDLNFRLKTLSFKGRHKLKMDFQFQDFQINLKWKNIELKNNCLFIVIEKAKDSVLPPHIASELKKHDNLVLHLNDKEMQSFKNNKKMMQYCGFLESEVNAKNTEVSENAPNITSPDDSTKDKNTPELPVTSRNNSITNKKPSNFKSPKTTKRKIFAVKKERDIKLLKQTKTKILNKKRSKILKPRAKRESVCKVVPDVIELTETPEHVETRPLASISHNRLGGTEGQLTAEQCSKILNAVNDASKRHETYNNYDESDAQPCPSYRNFKAHSTAGVTECTTKTSTGALHTEKLTKDENSNTVNISRPQKGNKRKLPSQNIFDELKDDGGSTSSGPSKRTRQCSRENKN